MAHTYSSAKAGACHFYSSAALERTRTYTSLRLVVLFLVLPSSLVSSRQRPAASSVSDQAFRLAPPGERDALDLARILSIHDIPRVRGSNKTKTTTFAVLFLLLLLSGKLCKKSTVSTKRTVFQLQRGRRGFHLAWPTVTPARLRLSAHGGVTCFLIKTWQFCSDFSARRWGKMKTVD